VALTRAYVSRSGKEELMPDSLADLERQRAAAVTTA
jgi:hypothetical protein